MSKSIEIWSDNDGNSITIEKASDGVYISASIKTKPPYTGRADESAARTYAKKHNFMKNS